MLLPKFFWVREETGFTIDATVDIIFDENYFYLPGRWDE